MALKTVRVWDLPTRLSHWLLAMSIAYAWVSVELTENMQHHFWAGYIALTTLLFRLCWAVFGSHHARFSSWLRVLPGLQAYLRGERQFLGHNPLGVLSSFALLISITLQLVTGLFNSDDYFHGPLSGYIATDNLNALNLIHEINSKVLLGLIGLHVVAILVYLLVKKQNLTQAMITGNKRIDPASVITRQSVNVGDHPWRATFILLVCCVCVYCVVSVFAQPLTSRSFDFGY